MRRKLIVAGASGMLLACLTAESIFRLRLTEERRAELERARSTLIDGTSKFEPHPYTIYAPRRTPEQLELTRLTEDRRGVAHSGGRRVLCLGASTTESGNPLGHLGSYPYYLERLLVERHGIEAEVLQGGVAGWTTAETLVAWMLDYRDFVPDVVLLHHAVNDLGPMGAPGFRSDYSHARRPLVMPEARGWEGWLLGASYLYTELRTRDTAFDLGQASKRVLEGSASPASTMDPGAVFIRNLRSIGADATRLGARVGLVTMPCLATPSAEQKATVEGVRRNNELLRTLATKEGWLLVDLERRAEVEFRTDERDGSFLDAVHVSPQGNFTKAEMIAEALVQAWSPESR